MARQAGVEHGLRNEVVKARAWLGFLTGCGSLEWFLMGELAAVLVFAVGGATVLRWFSGGKTSRSRIGLVLGLGRLALEQSGEARA